MAAKVKKGIIVEVGYSTEKNSWFYKTNNVKKIKGTTVTSYISNLEEQYCSSEEIDYKNVGKTLLVEFDGMHKPTLFFE